MTRRWQVIDPAVVARGTVRTARSAVSSFLAIAGIVFIVIGLLYRYAYTQIPHILQHHLHALGHHGPAPHRSLEFLVGGALCVALAWLIRPRHS